MDILTIGKTRFVIKGLDQSRIYLQAKIQFFEDEHETASDNDSTLAGEVVHLLKEFDRISVTHLDYNFLSDTDLIRLSFLIQSIEGFILE
jgi:Lon protease-like protein